MAWHYPRKKFSRRYRLFGILALTNRRPREVIQVSNDLDSFLVSKMNDKNWK